MGIKSYTDISQSKKLAEILPIETADMFYRDDIGIDVKLMWEHNAQKVSYPCWSLAVLLELLPNEISTDDSFACHYQIDIRKHDWYDNTTLYQIAYGNDRGSSGSWHDMINTGQKENLIDCCVQMILKLNEQNLI